MKNLSAITNTEQLAKANTQVDLAKSQWALINNFEDEYRNKTVYGTNCKFAEDQWFNGDGKSDNGRINWKSRLTGGKALVLLLKVVFFEMISTNRLMLSTINSKLSILNRSFIPLIENKNLLAGQPGDILLGLYIITDDDLLAICDTLIVSSSTKEDAINNCNNLSSTFLFIKHIATAVPTYQIQARLPWEKSKFSVSDWAKRRTIDLGATYRSEIGFSPLASETAMQIIERSLNLITEYGNHFTAISSIAKTYTNAKCFEINTALLTLETYGPIFRELISPPETLGLKSREVKVEIFRWIRKLLYLARGACINIILLTTGLRNSDIRRLKVGACFPSGRIDMLFYLKADIKKTKNRVLLPVPQQTYEAVNLLERIKFTNSPYLIDAAKIASDTDGMNANNPEVQSRLSIGDSLNNMIRYFAFHFNIPFTNQITGTPYSAHCYRTTVAGWLGAASNLSILMVRRLFGHSNDVMPTIYLRNNPAFIEEQKAEKVKVATETARQMALAASKGQLAGNKGNELERGYKNHVARYEMDKAKSHSLTDVELVISFSDLIEQRILNESVCGFMTPFGVRCMRNPSDTRQPPCAERSHRNKSNNIGEQVLKMLSDIDPQNCIGTSCSEAMIGPWSESIKESLLWYGELLRHQHDNNFSDEHFRAHAIQFIRQYGPAIKKVFGIEVLPSGFVAHMQWNDGDAK